MSEFSDGLAVGSNMHNNVMPYDGCGGWNNS